MLNLESLRIFAMAAETENFSRAAQHLHVSQPSVSQHIQALEQHLDVELFERRGRRINLSAAGATLLPLVNEVLRSSRRVEEAALALSGEVAGHLTIGCSTASGKYLLPRLLARYREKYPLVRATVKVGSRTQVIEWLLAGEVNLSVTSDRLQRGGLRFRRFYEDEIVLVVPSNHPWTGEESLDPRELYSERFILREMGSGTHSALLEALDQVGVDIDRLETVLVVDSSEAIVMAVEEQIGLGFVSRLTAERYGAWCNVQVVPLQGIQMTRWLYLVDNTQLPQPPALGAFLSYVDQFLPPRTLSMEEIPETAQGNGHEQVATGVPAPAGVGVRGQWRLDAASSPCD